MKIANVITWAGMVLALGATLPAAAQDYPQRAITFVVPFAPGGGNDTLARVVTARVGQELNGVFVVENRPGAGGGLAAELVAESPADGYMLLQGNIAHAINMSLYKDPGYDLLSDLTPVTMMATSPLLICVNPKLPVNTLQELIDLAKAQPGKLTYGSSGIGGSSHLAVELLKAKAGIDILHIPYQGSAPSITDLIAGRLDVALPTLSNAPQLIESGQIKCLASTSSVRSELLPDIPTIAEAAGIPDYEALPWYGVMAPAGTPPDVVNKLAAAFKAALSDPTVKATLAQQGFDVVGDTPEEFGAYIKSEVAKWKVAVEFSGATAE